MTIRRTLLLLPLLLSGCFSDNPDHSELANLKTFSLEDAARGQLVRDLHYAGTSSPEIPNIGDVTVDGEGNIYLVDEYRSKLRVLNDKGTLVEDIGRPGNQPGEFKKPGDITYLDSSIYAYDEDLAVLYKFSVDGYKLENSIYLNEVVSRLPDSLDSATPHGIRVMEKDTFLASFQWVRAPDDRRLYYFMVDEKGMLISDLLMTFRNKSLHVENTSGGPVIMSLPYERETLIVTGSAPHFYSINTDEILVTVYDSSGTYNESRYYPFKSRSLNESEVINMFTNVDIRRAVRGLDLPSKWPAVAKVVTDDNDQLWIATISSDLQYYEWYILGSDGKPIAFFEFPVRKEIMHISKDKIYAKEFNPRMYSEEIIQYSLKIEGN